MIGHVFHDLDEEGGLEYAEVARVVAVVVNI
jgi:hypothetical protein